jgi:hypothetical protein
MIGQRQYDRDGSLIGRSSTCTIHVVLARLAYDASSGQWQILSLPGTPDEGASGKQGHCTNRAEAEPGGKDIQRSLHRQ